MKTIHPLFPQQPKPISNCNSLSKPNHVSPTHKLRGLIHYFMLDSKSTCPININWHIMKPWHSFLHMLYCFSFFKFKINAKPILVFLCCVVLVKKVSHIIFLFPATCIKGRT